MAWIRSVPCKNGVEIGVPKTKSNPEGKIIGRYFIYGWVPGGKRQTDGGGGYLSKKAANQAKTRFELKIQGMRNGTVREINLTVEGLREKRHGYMESIGRSKGSLSILNRNMNLLAEFSPGMKISDFTSLNAIQFKDWLLAKEYDWKKVAGKWVKKRFSINGVRHTLTSVRDTFGFAVKRQVIAENPFKGILDDLEEQDVAHYLSMEEVERLLRACRYNQELLDIVFIGLYTGMRRGEILGMEKSWILPDHIHIPFKETFRTKTGKPRKVPINTRIKPILEKYAQSCAFSNQRLFSGWDNDRFEKAYRRAVKRSGIVGRTRIHDLRHSFASNFLESGANETEVGMALGHKDPNSTARYTHIKEERLVALNNKVDYPIEVPVARKVTMPKRKTVPLALVG